MINQGHDRAQLAAMSKKAKAALGTNKLEVLADAGYFSGEEILACDEVDITATLPKPLTSGNKAKGLYVKQDFRSVADEDVYICPAGERLAYHFTNVEKGMTLRRYWTARRNTVEHPFGTIKSWMGATHFQMRTLKKVGTEMALHVLACNLKRVMNILGMRPLIAAMLAA